MEAINIKNLTKDFKSPRSKTGVLRALDNVSFDVKSGSIYGLLGQNGAGKTTLIKILLGIVFPTKGNYSLLNENEENRKVMEKIGFLPENHSFPKFLSAKEFLYYYGRLSHLNNNEIENRTKKLLDLVGLSERSNSKIRTFSKGMQQRLGLAQALINDPNLIFLDEPTDGVDPIGRKEIRDILVHLKNEGKTIFLNSHLLSEVEIITDRVAFLNQGKLVKEGSIEDLTKTKLEFNFVLSENSELSSRFPGFQISHVKENFYHTHFDNEIEMNNFIDELRKNDILIKEITPIKNSLEDIFINLVNSKGADNNV
jgi:ABC-2 type transport system ATP-binding protein